MPEVAVLPELTEDLQAALGELRPQCEARMVEVAPGVLALTWGDAPEARPGEGERCQEPAVWIARAACPVCRVVEAVMLCDPHRTFSQRAANSWLCNCRAPHPHCRVSWERI